MARQPRQRPISCKLCRQRKLRCSRVFPCSNCVCRGLECVHDGPTSAATAPSSAISPGAVGGGGGANANAAAASQDKTAQLPKELPASELLARLEKLEALVANQSRDVPAVPPVVPPPPPISQPQRPLPAFPGNTPNLTSHTTATTSSPISPQIQRLTDDALWLERSCSGNSLVESLVSDPITFRACPIRRITKQPSFIFQSDPSSAQLGIADVIKCIWLPRRDEARIILDKYISDVDHFHHVIHIPTLRKLLETTYDTIESTATPDIGAVILILSVCATCTYSWSLEDDARQLYADVGEARAQATAWIKATLDVIDHAHRTVSSSMECIQGMIILFFVFCNLEGLSHRSRSLISKSIAMSREMGLHRIDSQVSLPETANMCTLRAEIGRRIWWCLVGTDWMMAQFAAPQESTYTIHPGHMAVRKPTNLNDEDVVEGKALIGRPLHYPTRVSALIFRLRLAELCQSLLEKNPSLAMNPDSLPYANVIEIDGKLRGFLQDLPDFFCLDNVTLRSLPPQDPRRAHHIVVQRYTLNLMLHRHLCKLHLPYLARGTVDATFSYSRNACLMSARMIIHAEKMLKMEGLPFSTTRLRSIMVIRSVFLASIVLVLNACLSNDVNGNDADTEHLIESWRILDEAKGQSVTAAKLLELSVQVLRRHAPNHVALSNLPQMASEPMPMTPESAPHDEQRKMMPQMELRPELDPTYIEQQWQALEGRMDLNTIDWDKLFYGLDAPFI